MLGLLMQIEIESDLKKSARVMKIESFMDLSAADNEHFSYTFDISQIRTWSVGLIVGPSGAGKSTIINKLLEDYPQESYPKDGAIPLIDWLNKGTVEERIDILNSVGIGSVNLWRRDYDRLSNGERHRADLAYAIMHNDYIIFDEFTSVIDRPQAKSIATALSKTIKRANKQIILASCHYDIADWLEPDWIFEPHKNSLSQESRRRPEIKISVHKTDRSNWPLFAQYHYMSAEHRGIAHCYIAMWEGEPVGWCSIRRFPHPKAKDIMKIHRLVVRPEYQGLGIGLRLVEAMAVLYPGQRIRITTTHPHLIKRMKVSDRWRMVSNGNSGKNMNNVNASVSARNFLMKTFQYISP